MNLTLLDDQELKVSFDPVGVEDRIPSVAFDVHAELSMPFQQTQMHIKECWFSHEALNAFEAELNALQHQNDGAATLLNMSQVPIVRIQREGGNLSTTIYSADSANLTASRIEVFGYATELPLIIGRLRSFEKWW